MDEQSHNQEVFHQCGCSQQQREPSFRFHPTDEELIIDYLCRKVADNKFVAAAIADVDMNKVEPWDLPGNAKMGDDQWYFFCVRDKKYLKGMRADRATVSGYWKSTAKDKEIFKRNSHSLLGMMKTLMFYQGRAPKGQKTNWVANEYRLEGNTTLPNLPNSVKNEWVICRVFQKTAGGKKIHISCIGQSSSLGGNEMEMVPPTNINPAPFIGQSSSLGGNEMEMVLPTNINTAPFIGVSNSEDIFQRGPYTNACGGGGQVESPIQANNNYCQFSEEYSMHDQGILRDLMENCGGQQDTNELQSCYKTGERFIASQETGLSTDINNYEISTIMSNLDKWNHFFEEQEPPLLTSSELPQGLESIWNY